MQQSAESWIDKMTKYPNGVCQSNGALIKMNEKEVIKPFSDIDKLQYAPGRKWQAEGLGPEISGEIEIEAYYQIQRENCRNVHSNEK